MEMQAPKNPSSNIKAIGYDADAKELHVEFAKGTRYKYSGVEPHVHKEMLQAESAGSYFAQRVRGQYSVEKLTGEW